MCSRIILQYIFGYILDITISVLHIVFVVICLFLPILLLILPLVPYVSIIDRKCIIIRTVNINDIFKGKEGGL